MHTLAGAPGPLRRARPAPAFHARRLLLACWLAVMGLCVAAGAARAEAVPTLFDLPGGPLKDALARYDAATRMSVFFPSELVEGRSAAPVRGRMAPEQALHRLLEGSGLVARLVAPEAFVLQPAGPDDAVPPEPVPAVAVERGYEQLLESRLLRALCERGDLALGSYRLALRVQVDAGGRAAQVRLLDSTGDRVRDGTIVETLRGVDVGQAPADPARPFVLLLRARTADAAPVCPGTGRTAAP
jgi:hypothetical protein